MKVVATCHYKHPVIGAIHVKVNASSKSLRARWRGQELCITIPKNCPADVYDRFLVDQQDKIMALKPQIKFTIGMHIETPLVDFIIDQGTAMGNKNVQIDIDTLSGKCTYRIHVNKLAIDYGIAEPVIQQMLNSALVNAATHAARRYLIPIAKQLADKIERRPLGWDIKETRTRLGCCTSQGIITLSPRLIFLPEHLRNFVIYHELAHLSEMNHSAAFHELCNRYCGGCEAELRAELKGFKFPIT